MPNWWMQLVKQTSAFLSTERIPTVLSQLLETAYCRNKSSVKVFNSPESQLQDLHLRVRWAQQMIANFRAGIKLNIWQEHWEYLYTLIQLSLLVSDATVTTEQNRTFTSARHACGASATISTGAKHTETSFVTQCTDLKRKIYESISRGLRCLNTRQVSWSWPDCCVAKCMQKQSLLPTRKQTMRNELPLKIKYYTFIILI